MLTASINVSGLFFFGARFGDLVTVEKARHMLHSFGKLEEVYAATASKFHGDDGVMVQFEMYDDGQKAFNVRSSQMINFQLLINPSTIAITVSFDSSLPMQTSRAGKTRNILNTMNTSFIFTVMISNVAPSLSVTLPIP